ncbi:hypothetical protein DV515_00010129 [Chloebia gouldiae]|uniref:Uncharacterized protein n=1 Tax=Chloebia gouldiae TaxID=44316 RepID=A0A3L8S9W3_CHLGU|nr:hypothetical protein DV515_00010129 [Chloebia gouldiae]
MLGSGGGVAGALHKAALAGPFPERSAAVRCRPRARGGQMWGIRSRRLPSPPDPSARPWGVRSDPTSAVSPLSSPLESHREMLPWKSLKQGLMDAGVGSRSSWNDTREAVWPCQWVGLLSALVGDRWLYECLWQRKAMLGYFSRR